MAPVSLISFTHLSCATAATRMRKTCIPAHEQSLVLSVQGADLHVAAQKVDAGDGSLDAGRLLSGVCACGPILLFLAAGCFQTLSGLRPLFQSLCLAGWGIPPLQSSEVPVSP